MLSILGALSAGLHFDVTKWSSALKPADKKVFDELVCEGEIPTLDDLLLLSEEDLSFVIADKEMVERIVLALKHITAPDEKKATKKLEIRMEEEPISASPQVLSNQIFSSLTLGEYYEGPDVKGNWWPMRASKDNGNGTYEAIVSDGYKTVWKRVLAKKARLITKLAVGKEYEIMLAKDQVATMGLNGDKINGNVTPGSVRRVVITGANQDGTYKGKIITYPKGIPVRVGSNRILAHLCSPVFDHFHHKRGDIVEARGEDGKWVKVTIQSSNENKHTYTAIDENGLQLDAVPARLTRRCLVLKPGMTVDAQDAKGRYYPVTITKDNKNGTFQAAVDDGFGSKWYSVTPRVARIREPIVVKKRYEALSANNTWWPITVIKKNSDSDSNGKRDKVSFKVKVHDEVGTVWKSVMSRLTRVHPLTPYLPTK